MAIELCSVDGNSRFPLRALPDSGADCSCFPKEWAEPLGIDLDACESRRVITGAGRTNHFDHAKPLAARILGRDIELSATFGPVGIGILGRHDFFSYFQVEFDERERFVRLRPYAE